MAKIAAYFSWITAALATSGSLYASEIAHFPPCVLCWYQRIAMYPLVVIIAVGILTKDKKMPYYVLPLAILGAMVGVIHNLLYYKILPEAAIPCQLGISCTTKFIEFFGFVTIPFLSLMSFVVIIGCMVFILRSKEK